MEEALLKGQKREEGGDDMERNEDMRDSRQAGREREIVRNLDSICTAAWGLKCIHTNERPLKRRFL